MGKFTDYKLMLKTLPIGQHAFSYHLDKQFFMNMENADVRDANIDVALSVKHSNDVYALQFHLTGSIIVACDRCLDDLELPIDATYDLIVKYGDDYDDSSDTILILPESDNYLNVAYMIHDTAVLAIPSRHVHPAGKCNRAMSALNKKYVVSTDEDDLMNEDDFDTDLQTED